MNKRTILVDIENKNHTGYDAKAALWAGQIRNYHCEDLEEAERALLFYLKSIKKNGQLQPHEHFKTIWANDRQSFELHRIDIVGKGGSIRLIATIKYK
jgi:mRNA-degrading endonuclease HigB of HigAB toxin-antitoxin module